jgi:hypothetical protein
MEQTMKRSYLAFVAAAAMSGGSFFLWAEPSSASDAQQAAVQCALRAGQDVQTFSQCLGGAVVLPSTQMTLVRCAEGSHDTDDLAECASRELISNQLTREQRQVVECARSSDGDADDFVGCMGSAFIGARLSPQQKALLKCANDADDAGDLALCAGETLFGDRLTREQKMAVECAVESEGDFRDFAGCAATKFLNANLNPEQRIAVECVVETGGQPYAAGVCTAARLTGRELAKCAMYGIGGPRGCFGDNNDLVGRNGWVMRNVRALAGGPNSMFNNPGQVWGGPNSMFNNPGQVWGGPNSVFNNPGQLVPQLPPPPPPLQLGTVGGHRVCIPWC